MADAEPITITRLRAEPNCCALNQSLSLSIDFTTARDLQDAKWIIRVCSCWQELQVVHKLAPARMTPHSSVPPLSLSSVPCRFIEQTTDYWFAASPPQARHSSLINIVTLTCACDWSGAWYSSR